MTTDWTKNELLVYLLIWCANADFIEHDYEVELLLSKTNEATIKKIKKEIDRDNDMDRLNKVSDSIERLGLDKSDVHHLFQEMKEMFLSDGEYSMLEKNLERGLKHLLM